MDHPRIPHQDEDDPVFVGDSVEVMKTRGHHHHPVTTSPSGSIALGSNGIGGDGRRQRTHSSTAEEAVVGRRGGGGGRDGGQQQQHRRRRTHSTTEEVFVTAGGGRRSSSSSQHNRLSSARSSGEQDEEVTFSDPLSLEDFDPEVEADPLSDSQANKSPILNGLLTRPTTSKKASRLPYHQRPMPASKKKRKSSDEKFLEDNSDYYGIKVLPTKLRSSHEHPEKEQEEEKVSTSVFWPACHLVLT